MDDFAADFRGAVFDEARESTEGVMAVPYQTPDSDPDVDEALTFVEVDGKWYWFGASTSSGPDPGDFG